MSRGAQPSCRRARPSLHRGPRRRRLTSLGSRRARGRSRARAARRRRRSRGPRAPAPPAGSPSPAGPARAGSAGRLQPSAGAEPRPTRWGPVSHFPWLAGPAPGLAGPVQPRRRPPTVGAPSLLELLDLLQAQPRALVDAEVTQHLLHRLCVRVLHGCGGPAGLASRPRGLLASASHSDRGLVPPRAPRRGLASPPPPPPPPPAASASRGAESPRTPPADNCPSRGPASPAPASGSAGRRGAPDPPSPPPKRGPPFALNSPSGAQAAAPEPPPRAPEVIRGPARAGGGGAWPSADSGTDRGQPAQRVVRSALARFPQPRTPDSGGGNCGGGEGGGVGDGSAAAALIAFIRRCLPSRRRRGMWTPLIGREGPARRGRRGPAPSLLRDSRPRCHAGPAPRAPPPGTRIEAAVRPAARCLAQGELRPHLSGACAPIDPHPSKELWSRGATGSRRAPCTRFPEGAACPWGRHVPGWQPGSPGARSAPGSPKRTRVRVLGSPPRPWPPGPHSAA